MSTACRDGGDRSVDTPVVPDSASEPVSLDGSRLVSGITHCLVAIVIGIGTLLPLGYLWLASRSEAQETAAAARLYAVLATHALAASRERPGDAMALLPAPSAPGDAPEARLLRDASGAIVATSGPPPAAPTLVRKAPLGGPGHALGTLEVQRSLRPLLWEVFGIWLLGSAFGVALFMALRRRLLGAVEHLLARLKTDQKRERQETAERLSIVFDHSLEGILTFLPSGRLLSCNAAASRLFDESPEALVGRNLGDLVVPPPARGAAAPFGIGHFESTGKRSSGVSFPLEMTVSQARLTGQAQLIGILRDITERKRTEGRLSYLANFDGLTGLPNRMLFRERLAQAMERCRLGDSQMALIFLDLDRFKVVNDSLGHETGDRLLRHVAQTLLHCVRRTRSPAGTLEPVTVARLGGDEFTVIVEGLAGPEEASQVATRILERLRVPFIADGAEIFASASLGITMYPHDATDLDGLIRHADLAMYRSKDLGRNAYHFFSDELNDEITERLSLEMSLRHALERNEFELQYQPKADLRSGSVTGMEALLRWRRPGDSTLVAPDRFITVLEETGLIVAVGSWVLFSACRQLAEWDRQGMQPVKLAINLSARQFQQPDLPQVIARALREAGLAPSRLEVELTESLLMRDNAVTLSMLAALKEMGVSVAIDDFGTGHSSLAYLKRFDVDTLKVDRTFVRDTPNDPEDNAITTAVIALGHSLGLKVVAEGVESLAQAEFLRDLGCDEIQGYLLSRPMAASQVPGWMSEQRERISTQLAEFFEEPAPRRDVERVSRR
jgi:diguanylate cyclase (GGDEF)-like protein/PAS domain S-box-containing protein